MKVIFISVSKRDKVQMQYKKLGRFPIHVPYILTIHVYFQNTYSNLYMNNSFFK